jgi:hypothetical protein
MSKSFFYKIQDPTTGLYWGGYKTMCGAKVGTRFVGMNEVQFVYDWMERHHGGCPAHWEVVYVEIEEHERQRLSGDNLKIITSTNAVSKILTNAGFRRTLDAGIHFKKLRANGELHDWLVMAELTEELEYARSKPKRVKFFEALNIPSEHYRLESPRVVVFNNHSAATMAKLGDAAGAMIEIEYLCKRLASVINVAVESV